MHIHFGTALIVAALVASILLVLNRGDRLFPMVAIVASGVEALIAFGILTLSVSTFRIDVILPAALTIAGGICWARSSVKSTIAASTVVLMVGVMQLLLALNIFN
ncbi:MAG: hypothetical protein JWO36_7323 [Myxococcales bacterium]|nr:hypothetical protein [Myxococcales bacterium]